MKYLKSLVIVFFLMAFATQVSALLREGEPGDISLHLNGYPVPELAIMLLFGLGLLGFTGIYRKKFSK